MDDVRLDIWLDVACLFKTRSEAQAACKIGRVSVNRQPAKPNRHLRLGDEIEINRPMGRKQTVRVRALADTHIAKADARNLYERLGFVQRSPYYHNPVPGTVYMSLAL